MGLLRDEDAVEIRRRLSAMTAPVKLVHFTQELNLEYGQETRQVIEELAALSDKLSLEVYDFILDKEKVAGEELRSSITGGRNGPSSRRAPTFLSSPVRQPHQ